MDDMEHFFVCYYSTLDEVDSDTGFFSEETTPFTHSTDTDCDEAKLLSFPWDFTTNRKTQYVLFAIILAPTFILFLIGAVYAGKRLHRIFTK